MKMMGILILALVCLVGGSSFAQAYEEPPYSKIVDTIMARASKRLEKKHHMKLIGMGEGMMGCVKMMGFSFQINRHLEKDEARSIAVDCVQDFLADINQEEKIRQYLEVYPFDEKHIEIFIFINTPDGERFYHPNVSVVTANGGNIRYSTNDPENENRYTSEVTETFEDAVKILQGENSTNP